MATNALTKTLAHARSRGWHMRSIDDDCFILTAPSGTEVQVTFDNYSPSGKFVAASLIGNDDPCAFVVANYPGLRRAIDDLTPAVRLPVYERLMGEVFG